MTDLESVYSLRRDLSARHQPGLAAILASLHDNLLAYARHPYALSRAHVKLLMAVPEFAVGAAGASATPRSEYVYRLTPTTSLVDFADWMRPADRESIEEVFDGLQRDSDREIDGWLPLRRYARGPLSAYRGFTWWTEIELSPATLPCVAHQLGLPNDWISPYSVILRCPVAVAGRYAKMPTEVDAFTSAIFHPCRDDDGLCCGVTVNLDALPEIRDGQSELLLQPLPIQDIDLLPVSIERTVTARHDVRSDTALWGLLCHYYRAALGGP